MAVAIMFNTDILTQVYLQTITYTVFLVVAIAVLLRGVKERPPPQGGAALVDAPVIPSVRAMFANKPYMHYLLFRVPMTIAALLPSNLLVRPRPVPHCQRLATPTYSLLTAHCSLLAAHHSLLTTHCSLLTTNY